MAEQTPIEKKLFTWESWDQHDTACFEFYDCKLIKPIKRFNVGCKFDSIVIDYEYSTIEFYNNTKLVAKFNIELNII
jgi:hypothetical protein